VPVAGGLRFTTISTGSNHTCGVTLSDRAYCWGANAEGRLGDGTTMQQSTPVPVAGGLSFTTIRGGDFHTCGLTTTNGAYCWGANNRGQLGDGTTNGSLTPVPVVGSGGGPASVAMRADRR
jgi:alpha-tubulin suppressor-like RCC1 family protein